MKIILTIKDTKSNRNLECTRNIQKNHVYAKIGDRWVMATFEDSEMAAAAQTYQQRKQLIKGLNFLLVQPDDSGMTYSGFWLLQDV